MSTSQKIHSDFFPHGGEKVEMLGNYICSTALFHHHFLKVQQLAYLKEAKALLDNETCIILMDFAESYSFLVQDAIESFFWQNQQATLIPLQCTAMMMMMVNFNVTVIVSYQTAVHCFISLVIPTICTRNPRINRIKNFSDEEASQYKNFKSLINLMYCEHDFNLKAENHFFATSHRKSPCDGIGGTIKREAAVTNQILTPEQLFL